MSRRLSERYPTAFVSGAGAGLGRAFTQMLLAEGVRVWGTSRDPARLPSAPGFTPVRLDLSEPVASEAAFRAAAEQAGGAFDLVINNAGYGVFGEFGQVGFCAWREQIEAMVNGTLRLTHAAWRQMLSRRRGCLVNVSSLAAEFPLPLMTGYNVAKAALSALSESLIFESRGTGVRVIDFRPGDYRTGFNRAMQVHSPDLAAPSRAAALWPRLDALLAEAPPPAGAARDLQRALAGKASGVVRSGSFFQARVAPFLARFLSTGMRRSLQARYYGLS